MKLGDLVRHLDPMPSEQGVGIVIDIQPIPYGEKDWSICVSWSDDWFWYHTNEIEAIDENR